MCGIVGMVAGGPVNQDIYDALLLLQHRGQDATGIALKRTQTRISARRAQAKESKVLEIPNMAPLLCVRTLNHRDGEIDATEYSVSLTRADMIEFTMEH